ncbi:MAG: polyprenyl synthetase family protein [Eubacteriales bacterium]|nr:polyprenyl synthetase family protein [Eubacteriales bacterium]
MWSNYPEIAQEIDETEKVIYKNIKSRNRLLTKICSGLNAAGGKRIRPALAVIASRFGSFDAAEVRKLAGAIEILHMATLIHDDVIDRSETRRGKITVSAGYGPDMAIYTGDFLFTRAVAMLASLKIAEAAATDAAADSHKLPDMAAEAVKLICEGEVDQYLQRFDINISARAYLKRIYRKTAVLFSAACAMGAVSAGCEKSLVKILGRYGFYYGMAFQMRDDLNDFISDEEAEGKPVIKDITEGVYTLPLIYTMSGSSELRRFISGAVRAEKRGAGRIREDDAAKIVKIVKDNGGIAYTLKMIDRYVDKGLHIIKTLPWNPGLPLLAELLYSLGSSPGKTKQFVKNDGYKAYENSDENAGKCS